MAMTGTLRIGGYDYFIQMFDTKSYLAIILFTPYHDDDVINYEMGNDLKYPLLTSEYAINKDVEDGYVMGAIKRLKASGKVYTYKDSSVIENVLSTISFANNYKFANRNISINEDVFYLNENKITFSAKDENLSFEYATVNGLYNNIHITYGDVQVDLVAAKSHYQLKKIIFTEADNSQRKRILENTIKVIDYQMLCDSLDMSWYKKDDVLQKDYKTIKTTREFETMVITPIVLGIQEAMQNNTIFDVTLDTETTGLNVFNLTKDNVDKDHCVAIPMSWKEDTGVTIFTDMEYFSNVSNEYAAKRLGEIFENFTGEREIEIYVDAPVNVESSINEMDFFAPVESKKDVTGLQKRKVTIIRKHINLIGHNVMFDGRVIFDLGTSLYFNNDTLQMSFDLNPTLIKGSNKLKMLTRKLFGHETPELTDILGKGNEDKYRYLSVEEVAKIYGCADGDYTLKVFHVLRKIMSDRMYAFYQKQDVPMLNILYKSEYYGMQTIESLLYKEAEKSRENLEILKNFIYQYVGSFVSVYKRRLLLDKKRQANLLTEDEYNNEISKIKVDTTQPFVFELKASEIRKVLYEILKYPIKGYTKKGLPKTDKFVIEKLVKTKRNSSDKHFTKLEQDVIEYGIDQKEYESLKNSGNEKKQKKAKQMVLISADEFNQCKYPLAIALKKYAELNKEYTSYFAPMEHTNMEGKIFKNYSLARIETRRIMNPGQTMKGNLKALIRSYNDDYYILDFDMSQVEYRIMLSLAGFMLMVDKMSDPEKDYHTETASLINTIPAHKVDKKTRKNAKSVSFGVPYGLGERSLCEKLFGVVNEETLLATRMLLAKWEAANRPIMDFLNKTRDDALVAREMTKELRDFMDAWVKDDKGDYVLDSKGDKVPKQIGFSYNAFGFYRTYDLSNIDTSIAAQQRRANGIFNNEEGKIRRPAGNYPIQSFAAELFRIILIRFYNRCVEEGIADKIIWHMLIHDELLCSVHKSIHPFFMYKIVKESCMVTMKGHTKYFVGINIGNTWAEAKDDAREAPVYFVERVIKRWDAGEFGQGPFWFDNPWEELIKPERAKYVEDRIYEVIHKVQPDIDTAPINIPHILEHFDNYTVRAYVNDYATNYDVDKSQFDLKERAEADEYEDRVWVTRFETWALKKFGTGKPMYDYDGRLVVLRDRSSEKFTDKEQDDFDFVDFEDLFDDEDSPKSNTGYWSFDEVEANETYDAEYVFYTEEEEDITDTYDLNMSNKNARNLAQMFNKKKEYDYITILNDKAIITADGPQIAKVKEFLKPFIAKDGISVMIKSKLRMERWVKVKTRTDFKALDKYLKELNSLEENSKYNPVNYRLLNNQLIVTIRDDKLEKLQEFLEPYKANTGQAIIIKTYLGRTKRLSYFEKLPYSELDNLIGTLK